MKTLITKDELRRHIGLDEMIDRHLRQSTARYWNEEQADLMSWEEWTATHGDEYVQQLQRSKEVIKKIDGAFKVLCSLKRQGVIDFNFNDVIELVKALKFSEAEAYGFVYLKEFRKDLLFTIKANHKIWAK